VNLILCIYTHSALVKNKLNQHSGEDYK